MRPVLLEMNGFASFREPTTVDFAGADYFALVGPTGSGKSTVIDAMTFALYGSVPRWDNQRTVSLALAPTAGRGTVRFVFDVAGQRFVVARELRRSAAGSVSVRTARLERLADPAGTGAVDEETVPIADGAGPTTAAVEALLGLPFGDFCTCVVLPQGEFAEFLHTEPRKRQEKLVRILGLGVYDEIARNANSEAAEQKQRAEILGKQLDDYADATPEAEREAAAREAELEALAERVGTAVPELRAATVALVDAEASVERMRADQARLRALSRPDGLVDLHERERSAATAAASAVARTTAAESADTQARELLAGTTDRRRLEQVRLDHAELAAGRAELPGARDRAEKARSAYDLAAQDAADARAALDAARAAREAATSALTAAQESVRRLVAERDGLRTLTIPAGLDVLDRRRSAAAGELESTGSALAAAEATDSRARTALSDAPARGPLEQARRDHRDLVAAEAELREAMTALARADDETAAITARLTETRHALDHALARRAESQRSNLVAALRPGLVAGDHCPVCEQEVGALPGPLPGADLADAERVVADAERVHEQARSRQTAAELAQSRVAGEVERLGGVAERLRTALAGAVPEAGDPADPAGLRAIAEAVDDGLATLDRLAERAEAADAQVRAARRQRDAAAAEADAVRDEIIRAASALRAARDPLVPFGAPAVAGDDVLAGWAALVAWARAEAAERDGALPSVRDAARDAEDAQEGAERVLLAAERSARDRREDETAAARAEQEARGAVAVIEQRAGELRVRLVGAPTDAEAAAELARCDELEAAARTADAELRAARVAQRSADRASADVAREVGAAWDALRAARDPLVPLDAPAVTGDDLLAAWTALTGWAAARSVACDEQLSAAEAAARAAAADRLAVERRLVDDLAEHAVPVGGALAEAAPTAVAAVLERARGARWRVAERRATAASIAADRDDAESAQQVAKMLGGLLRSDAFPRWLVASALDTLVADASAGLAELSGGQFELTHAGGEFLVIDHADADARRPVKTLSGGETFQASLALALALSAQMSSLAAKGAARLESIFLDEGFGTLDEANLEVVASTLETLATRGDRVVGVITHVPALAERVPVRFAVSRDQRTSSVVREDL